VVAVDRRTVVVTGATGTAGAATVRELRAAGMDVVATGRDRDRLRAFVRAQAEAALENETATALYGDAVDLTDETAVRAWAASRTPVDGVIHLVGGWRGGARFQDNTMVDADWLHEQIVRTTQVVSLAFFDDLVAAPAGRFAIVSAKAAGEPTAGNAAYASAKGAAEAWTRAMAHGFATAQADPGPLRAAATIFVVDSLVDDEMRAADPGRAFKNATDVDDLAKAVVGLWETDAADINGVRVMLAP
jgi:NADP-dependent 3-hydroxy acid dehydrogenase YdfG